MDPVELINVLMMAILGIAMIVGLVKGLVRQVIELVGIIAAFVLAMIFAGWLAETLRLHTPLPYSPSLVVAFIALLVAGIIASHFIAMAVQKIIRMTFLGWFDRVCGGALGIVVGLILLSLMVSVALELPISGRARGYVQSSEVCMFVRPIAPTIFNAILSHGPTRSRTVTSSRVTAPFDPGDVTTHTRCTRGSIAMTGNESAPGFSHAAATLEFGAVLELIVAHCVNASARALVRSLAPTADHGAIQSSHREIEEYRRHREEHGDVPVGDTGCRGDLERMGDRREAVAPERLLAIAAAERGAVDMHSVLMRAEGVPRLRAIAAGIVAHPGIVEAIERAIDVDGSIKDTASSALKSIRRDLHGLRASLRTLSEKLVVQFGSETVGTMLGQRYVVVVPRGKIRKRTGLVHSTSHSGGSLYFEPFGLVERNNDLESRVADEKAEEARILDQLRASVAECADELLANLDAVDRLDVIRAKSRFADEFDCSTPETSTSGRLRLVDARHPVLDRLLGEGGRTQVPLGLLLDPDQRLMVITGPNAGGKTVALKTVGVGALLFQCGLQVPCAQGSEIPLFERVFVDIGDEQSMESSLSTFTSHLQHLDTMIRRADANTLCLIDEIGDGTDPDEGAALAIATLERLLESRAAVIATTHYGRIKAFALESSGVTNASMAFEDAEGRPLYRLLQGVAGRSRGLETAQRAGFDREITERARSLVGAEAFKLETVLSDLEAALRRLEAERESVESRSQELDRLIADYRAKASQYDMTRKEALRKASREAEAMLETTRRETEHLVKSIRESQAEARVIRESRRKIEGMMEKTRKVRRAAEPERGRPASVRPGDRVAISASGSPVGVVTSVDDETATVEIAGKRIRLKIGALYEASGEGGEREAGVTHDFSVDPLTSTSLDVRGHDREEAIAAVTRFIDQAVYTGVREVKIIHGVGTGVLVRAVGELLRDDHRVESTRSGEQVEGGVGVTIVTLAG